MSSSVLQRALVCASLAFVIPAAAAQTSQGTFSCHTKQSERALLKQAPKEVRRASKHVLEITLSSGKQRFVDEPPYAEDGEIDGTRWQYCGFDKGAKAYLIEMADGILFSGKLLMQESGKQLPAGHTVLFSPTMKTYLAIEQQNGRDGEDWTVRDMAGKTIWTGYAGTLVKDKDADGIASFFEEPAWNERGELTARVACLSGKPGGVVTLVREPSGKWRWRGHGKCN